MIRSFIFICLASVVITSCSKHQRIKDSTDTTAMDSMEQLADTVLLPTSKPTVFQPPYSIEEEFLIHDSSIKADTRLVPVVDRPESTFKAAEAFSKYVQENHLLHPSDARFIANRKLLTSFETQHCSKDSIVLSGPIRKNDEMRIVVRFEAFHPDQHLIKYRDSRQEVLASIDGKRPYGSAYELPTESIASIELNVFGKTVAIPKEAFGNLYEVFKCNGSGFEMPITAYSSLNQEYVYLYLMGGRASETYFSKLVFSRQGYVTRILCDYEALSRHASFHKDFIGF